MKLIKIKCKDNTNQYKSDRIIYLLPYINNLSDSSLFELFENAHFPLNYESEQKIICLLLSVVEVSNRTLFLIFYNLNFYYFYLIPEEYEIEMM